MDGDDGPTADLGRRLLRWANLGAVVFFGLGFVLFLTLFVTSDNQADRSSTLRTVIICGGGCFLAASATSKRRTVARAQRTSRLQARVIAARSTVDGPDRNAARRSLRRQARRYAAVSGVVAVLTVAAALVLWSRLSVFILLVLTLPTSTLALISLRSARVWSR
ncbi:hypothetical protein [Nocardioides marmoraquaticus]